MSSRSFRLRSVVVSAYGPSLLYGFSSGVIAPVVAISAIERGATLAVAGLMGIGSLVANIRSRCGVRPWPWIRRSARPSGSGPRPRSRSGP
jgi:hypothetical protein